MIAGGAVAGGQDVSCAMSAVLLARVRRALGEAGVEQLLTAAGSRRSAAYLSDLGAWIAIDEALALWRVAAEALDDRDLPHAVGGEVVALLGGSGTSSALRALGSPEALLRSMPVVSKRFSVVADLEAVDVREGDAVVHMTAADGHDAHAEHCAWTAGMLTQSTALFGLAPARVVHDPCQVDGAAHCTFRVSWPGRAALAADVGAREASLARQLEAANARLQDVFDTAADLIGPGRLDETLARITERASLQVRATGYLLAVRATGSVRTHQKGLRPEEAAAVAARVLAPDAVEPPEHWLVVEVRSERHHYGALVATQPPGGRFLPQERQLMEVYARYAAAALDTATALAEARRGRAEAQRRDEESRALLQLARRLAGAASSAEVAQRLADAIPAVVDCDRVSVYLWSEVDGELRRAAIDVNDAPAAAGHGVASFLPATSPQLAAWLRRFDPAPVFIDPDADGMRERFGDLGVVAAVAVPIGTPSHLLGAFVATVGDGAARLAPRPELLDRLSGVAAHAVTALENGRLVDQITHQATHDGLTGVANRVGFASRMTAASRSAREEGRPFVVFYVDLDAIKPVNDAHGHEVGDDLLRAVAERLRRCLRPGDVVARLGGDEFAVLVQDEGHADGASVGRRLEEAFATPFVLGGRELRIGASIGRAVWPDDGRLPEELLRVADGAMYAVKRRRSPAASGGVA